MKVGNTDIQVSGPGPSDWFHLIVAFAPVIGLSILFGIIIPIVFRRHARIQIPASVVVGFAFYAVLIWRSNDPDIWSWRDPITSAVYQVAPAIWFCVAPTVLAAIAVRSLLSRRHAKSI